MFSWLSDTQLYKCPPARSYWLFKALRENMTLNSGGYCLQGKNSLKECTVEKTYSDREKDHRAIEI